MTVSELRSKRKMAGITQVMLSKRLKKNPSFICKLEAGNRLFSKELQMKVKKTLRQMQ